MYGEFKKVYEKRKERGMSWLEEKKVGSGGCSGKVGSRRVGLAVTALVGTVCYLEPGTTQRAERKQSF